MNAKRLLFSLVLITSTLGAVGFGATRAFFSDTETAVANVFTAGAIDLKVDNESYYNGIFSTSTSWEATDLTVEKFFNFLDLKPNDYGEDTISLHVDTNDSYMCANVTLTSNNENACTEPESLDDPTCGLPDDEVGEDLGELADLVNFIWWADDGDNVLEEGETVINQGNFGQLGVGNSYPLTLADSVTNIWNEDQAGGPAPGDETLYIGKAWCFGDIDPAPVAADEGDEGRSPAGDNNGNEIAGEPEDGGIRCDGTMLDNRSQTDSLTADVTFEAVQARNNPTFRCEVPKPRTTLTLVKQVFNSGPFENVPTDWTLSASGPTNISGIVGSPAVTVAGVAAGQYNLSESGPQGYAMSNWTCVGGTQDDEDTVTIAEGQNVTCTVTNYVQCTPEEEYADQVVRSAQGVRKNGTSVTADRTNPSYAVGSPQSTGAQYDVPVPNSFFSLGFSPNQNATSGGSIVLAFTNNYIVDGPGNDIRAWEVTGGTSYPIEKIKIEVSQDDINWYVVESSADRDTEADLADSGLTWAKYIRITDVSVRADFEATADGYDLDAVSALTCASVPTTE